MSGRYGEFDQRGRARPGVLGQLAEDRRERNHNGGQDRERKHNGGQDRERKHNGGRDRDGGQVGDHGDDPLFALAMAESLEDAYPKSQLTTAMRKSAEIILEDARREAANAEREVDRLEDEFTDQKARLLSSLDKSSGNKYERFTNGLAAERELRKTLFAGVNARNRHTQALAAVKLAEIELKIRNAVNIDA